MANYVFNLSCEKQIEKDLLNTNHMYSSIRVIDRNAVVAIKALELLEPEE